MSYLLPNAILHERLLQRLYATRYPTTAFSLDDRFLGPASTLQGCPGFHFSPRADDADVTERIAYAGGARVHRLATIGARWSAFHQSKGGSWGMIVIVGLHTALPPG